MKQLWLDQVYPMLRRQVQQDLNSRLFLGGLLLLYLFTTLITLFSLTIPEAGTEGILGALIFLAVVYFCIFLPITGLGTLAEERRENRIDLLLTSHLSPRGIVYAKWLALLLKVLLGAAAIAPFLVAMQLLSPTPLEQVAAGVAGGVVLSAQLCGVAVVLSAIKNVFLRIAVIVGCLIGSLILSAFVSAIVFSPLMSGGAATPLASPLLAWFAGTLYSTALLFAFFEVASLIFRSPTDRALLALRVFILFFLAFGVIALATSGMGTGLGILSLFTALGLFLFILAQAGHYNPLAVPVRHRQRHPIANGLLFSAGWPSALVLIVLVTAGGAASLEFIGDPSSLITSTDFILTANVLLLPLLPVVYLFKAYSVTAKYIAVQLGLVLLAAIIFIFMRELGFELRAIGHVYPHLALLERFRESSRYTALASGDTAAAFVLGIYLLSLLALLPALFRHFRTWREVARAQATRREAPIGQAPLTPFQPPDVR